MRRILACLLSALLLSSPALAGKRKSKKKGKFKIVSDANVEFQDRIEIRVHGLQSGEGWVICRLYEKKGWLKKAKAVASGAIQKRAAVCVFTDVRPGAYAVAGFHDENKDGEVDTDGVGGPGEGVFATGKVSDIKKKPPWSDCKFTYAGGQMTKSARVQYP